MIRSLVRSDAWSEAASEGNEETAKGHFGSSLVLWVGCQTWGSFVYLATHMHSLSFSHLLRSAVYSLLAERPFPLTHLRGVHRVSGRHQTILGHEQRR